MKTEQTTIVYAQWDRLTSYGGIKHHIITIDVTLKIFLVKNRIITCN